VEAIRSRLPGVVRWHLTTSLTSSLFSAVSPHGVRVSGGCFHEPRSFRVFAPGADYTDMFRVIPLHTALGAFSLSRVAVCPGQRVLENLHRVEGQLLEIHGRLPERFGFGPRVLDVG
jgi:hypothetical protein